MKMERNKNKLYLCEKKCFINYAVIKPYSGERAVHKSEKTKIHLSVASDINTDSSSNT